MDFLFGNPYVPLVAGALALLVAWQALSKRFAHGGASPLDGVLSAVLGPRFKEARLQKDVQRLKAAGDYLAAGKMLEDAGRAAEAGDVYLEGQEFTAAATINEQLGRLERAAELYLQAGDYKKAAKVMTDAGKPARAATLFLEKGNSLDAARLFGVANQWDKAGDLYLKGGFPLRAAEAYEKVGDFRKAAQCFERHFMENVSMNVGYSSTAASPDQKSALQAGRNYAKANDLKAAIQILTRGGFFKEAAESAVKLGQFAQGAELFMRADDPARAAEAFEKAGDRVKAANLRGEIAMKEGRPADAARFFQDGQDYQRAAELFEAAGLLAEAARAYEAAESHAAAGAVYIRAGLKDRAGDAYEKAGDFETAARLFDEIGRTDRSIPLYERAGYTFKSAEAAVAAGDVDKAIALLQRVRPEDEDFRAATTLLARLFVLTGRPALAIERVQRVAGSETVGDHNLDLHYWLAAAYEATDRARALGIYKKIQAEQLRFRDVEARMAALSRGQDPPAFAPLPPPRPAVPAPAPAAARPAAAVPVPAPAPAPAAPPRAPVAPVPAPSAPPAGAAEAKTAAAQRFVTHEEVGRGPLGVVFRAEDRTDGRSVALRRLPPALVSRFGPALAADLKAAAQVSHPNGVKVLGYLEQDGHRCVLSEFVSGRTLAEAVQRGSRMTASQAHSVYRVLAQYLSFVHGKGLVHGSIQPSNVMVASGVVKVADLGLGRLAHEVGGEPDYRAPERVLDAAGDLYATAAVIYHLLTGVHPRTQPQGAALPLPGTLATGVPEAFDKILIRALHPRPELRHASAEQVLQELKDMMRLA